MKTALALIFTLVALALLPAGAAAYPSKGGGIAGNSTITISLDGKLRQALDEAGIQVLPLKPAGLKGKALRFPLEEEGIFEPRYGTGYAFLRGGIRLRAGSRSVAVRTDFGIVVKVETLHLTTKGAQLLGGGLGRHDLLRPHQLLGRAVLDGEFFTIPVTGGSLQFTFDEGFRQKLQSLEVSVRTTGEAVQTSATPLAFEFPVKGANINRTLTHGDLFTSGSGMTLEQPATPFPNKVDWGSLVLSFENGYGGEGSDVVKAGNPIGQIDFGESPAFDPSTGTFSAGPTAATFSPYSVGLSNGTFAEGKPVFTAGEPFGAFSFRAGVR